MNGMPLIVVAKNLGHSTTRMVEKHYGQSCSIVWTAIGWQTAVVSRYPQMMPAIGKPWHRITAA